MSIETKILLHDPNTPVTQHPGLAADMYGSYLRNGQEILDVAAGRTDLQGDLALRGIDARVTAVDPAYETQSFTGKTKRVPGYAQSLEFDDESFDVSLCTFGMQHMSTEGKGSAIREMVRVTRTADDYNDGSKGIIFINPVFGVKKMKRALADQGVSSDDCGVTPPAVDGIIAHNRKMMASLYIHKTAELTDDKLAAIIDVVAATQALNPAHRSLGEMVSRALGGHSNT